MLQHDISLVSALVLGVFTSMSNFFTLTPNNLLVQEAVVAYLFTVVGYDFSTGLVGAGLARGYLRRPESTALTSPDA